MLKTGMVFGVSDELNMDHGKKTIGEIKKYLCWQENAGQAPENRYRTTGTAYEAGMEGKEEKRYFIKYLDIQALKARKSRIGLEEFKRSREYVHLCCMERERQLADLLKDTQICAYLVPPKYIFDVQEERNGRISVLKGSAYPYRGRSWQEVLRECRGSMNIQELFLLKERVVRQLLYAVRALHQLPGNLVHRDLKAANMRIERLEESYAGEIVVSIIDWDWVNIGQEMNDPFADICGGTSGFAHPRSFVKNKDHILDAVPSRRWDYYSAALTIYYILEETTHFKSQERYWESKDAYRLRDMPETRKYLESCCEPEQAGRCYEQIRMILQKMLGENGEYQNQYADIGEAMDDFEEYLMQRYGRSQAEAFQAKYLLHPSDRRYDREPLLQITCHYESAGTQKELFYVLAQRDALTVEIDGQQAAVLYRTGGRELYGMILAEGWKWERYSGPHAQLRYREMICCEKTGEKIELFYAQMG